MKGLYFLLLLVPLAICQSNTGSNGGGWVSVRMSAPKESQVSRSRFNGNGPDGLNNIDLRQHGGSRNSRMEGKSIRSGSSRKYGGRKSSSSRSGRRSYRRNYKNYRYNMNVDGGKMFSNNDGYTQGNDRYGNGRNNGYRMVGGNGDENYGNGNGRNNGNGNRDYGNGNGRDNGYGMFGGNGDRDYGNGNGRDNGYGMAESNGDGRDNGYRKLGSNGNGNYGNGDGRDNGYRKLGSNGNGNYGNGGRRYNNMNTYRRNGYSNGFSMPMINNPTGDGNTRSSRNNGYDTNGYNGISRNGLKSTGNKNSKSKDKQNVRVKEVTVDSRSRKFNANAGKTGTVDSASHKKSESIDTVITNKNGDSRNSKPESRNNGGDKRQENSDDKRSENVYVDVRGMKFGTTKGEDKGKENGNGDDQGKENSNGKENDNGKENGKREDKADGNINDKENGNKNGDDRANVGGDDTKKGNGNGDKKRNENGNGDGGDTSLSNGNGNGDMGNGYGNGDTGNGYVNGGYMGSIAYVTGGYLGNGNGNGGDTGNIYGNGNGEDKGERGNGNGEKKGGDGNGNGGDNGNGNGNGEKKYNGNGNGNEGDNENGGRYGDNGNKRDEVNNGIGGAVPFKPAKVIRTSPIDGTIGQRIVDGMLNSVSMNMDLRSNPATGGIVMNANLIDSNANIANGDDRTDEQESGESPEEIDDMGDGGPDENDDQENDDMDDSRDSRTIEDDEPENDNMYDDTTDDTASADDDEPTEEDTSEDESSENGGILNPPIPQPGTRPGMPQIPNFPNVTNGPQDMCTGYELFKGSRGLGCVDRGCCLFDSQIEGICPASKVCCFSTIMCVNNSNTTTQRTTQMPTTTVVSTTTPVMTTPLPTTVSTVLPSTVTTQKLPPPAGNCKGQVYNGKRSVGCMKRNCCQGSNYVSRFCPGSDVCCFSLNSCKDMSCSLRSKQLACRVVNAEKAGKIVIQSSAKANLQDACDGRPTKWTSNGCSKVCSPSEGNTCLSSKLLKYLRIISTLGGVNIQKIIGGCEDCDSGHYQGLTVDLLEGGNSSLMLSRCRRRAGQGTRYSEGSIRYIRCRFFE